MSRQHHPEYIYKSYLTEQEEGFANHMEKLRGVEHRLKFLLEHPEKVEKHMEIYKMIIAEKDYLRDTSTFLPLTTQHRHEVNILWQTIENLALNIHNAVIAL